MEEFGGGKPSQSISQSVSQPANTYCMPVLCPEPCLVMGKCSSKRLNPCYQGVHGIMMGKMHVNIKILQYNEMRAQTLWEAKERGANG